MKKVLSVVLAGAMILGMSVTAFADVEFGGSGTGNKVAITDDNFTWYDAYLYRDGKATNYNKGNMKLQPNDTLFFTFTVKGFNDMAPLMVGAPITDGKVPSNWKIKINNAEYVDGAEFYVVDYNSSDKMQTALEAAGVGNKNIVVKVDLSDFDEFDAEKVNFYFYVYDTENKTSSPKAKVSYDVKDLTENLSENDLDWVLTVKGATKYKYNKDAKSKLATFDFNGVAYTEVKLYPGETYNVDYSTSFNKDIARAYPEADFDFVELKGDFDRKGDVVIPSKKDNKYIYEVIGDELVEVDYEYVTGHKFASGEKVSGYLFQTDSLGQYAISDVELDLSTEEENTETKPEDKPNGGNTNNGDKGNPDTGANDFVGAAVALAVVSVAAAGALALKK